MFLMGREHWNQTLVTVILSILGMLPGVFGAIWIISNDISQSKADVMAAIYAQGIETMQKEGDLNARITRLEEEVRELQKTEQEQLDRQERSR